RNDHHEDDQEHQHDVDHRNDVWLVLELFTTSNRGAHQLPPGAGAAGLTTSPATVDSVPGSCSVMSAETRTPFSPRISRASSTAEYSSSLCAFTYMILSTDLAS